jgi:tetratricopeptide (TPR) repeat protein
LLSQGDKTNQDIISMAPNEKIFPIITFVYVQDFKSKITHYRDLYQIGSILAQRKQYSESISYFKKAIEAVRNVGDQLMESEILMGLATVEGDSGDYKQAVHDFNYALKIIEEIQIESLRPGCLLSLSKNLKKLSRFQEALDFQYMILEDTRTSLDRLGEAEILVDISDSLKGLGHIEDAIQYQQAAIDLRRQMNDSIGEANNLMVFGELLIGAGRTGEAMGCFEQALRIKKNLGDDRGVADCLRNMGKVFQDRGKYDKAKEYLEKAKEAYQNIALVEEVEKVNQLLDGMKERPYNECEMCSFRCNPSIVGITRSDASNDRFANEFKSMLRESLASKNMDRLVDLLTETGIHNLEVKMNNIPNDSYAFCLMIQATNLYLAQLTAEQKNQILEMVQKNIRIRKYSQL